MCGGVLALHWGNKQNKTTAQKKPTKRTGGAVGGRVDVASGRLQNARDAGVDAFQPRGVAHAGGCGPELRLIARHNSRVVLLGEVVLRNGPEAIGGRVPACVCVLVCVF